MDLSEFTLDELCALREICERALQNEQLSLELSDEECVRLRLPSISSVIRPFGLVNYNNILFRGKDAAVSLLEMAKDAISDEKKRRKILDYQVRAAKWSWLSCITATVSAVSALISAAAAVIAIAISCNSHI